MNIGRSQIQAAQRAARNRNLTERARQSNVAAFRRHQQEAATNDTEQPMPPLPPVDGGEVEVEVGGEDETFMSAHDRAINSPYSAINSAGGDDNLNDGTDYGFDPHGSEGDYAAEDYNFNDRTMHFLGGNRICRLTRQAVEIAVGIEALTVVTSEQTTNAAARNEKVLQVYRDTLNAFDDASLMLYILLMKRWKNVRCSDVLISVLLWRVRKGEWWPRTFNVANINSCALTRS